MRVNPELNMDIPGTKGYEQDPKYAHMPNRNPEINPMSYLSDLVKSGTELFDNIRIMKRNKDAASDQLMLNQATRNIEDSHQRLLDKNLSDEEYAEELQAAYEAQLEDAKEVIGNNQARWDAFQVAFSQIYTQSYSNKVSEASKSYETQIIETTTATQQLARDTGNKPLFVEAEKAKLAVNGDEKQFYINIAKFDLDMVKKDLYELALTDPTEFRRNAAIILDSYKVDIPDNKAELFGGNEALAEIKKDFDVTESVIKEIEKDAGEYHQYRRTVSEQYRSDLDRKKFAEGHQQILMMWEGVPDENGDPVIFTERDILRMEQDEGLGTTNGEALRRMLVEWEKGDNKEKPDMGYAAATIAKAAQGMSEEDIVAETTEDFLNNDITLDTFNYTLKLAQKIAETGLDKSVNTYYDALQKIGGDSVGFMNQAESVIDYYIEKAAAENVLFDQGKALEAIKNLHQFYEEKAKDEKNKTSIEKLSEIWQKNTGNHKGLFESRYAHYSNMEMFIDKVSLGDFLGFDGTSMEPLIEEARKAQMDAITAYNPRWEQDYETHELLGGLIMFQSKLEPSKQYYVTGTYMSEGKEVHEIRLEPIAEILPTFDIKAGSVELPPDNTVCIVSGGDSWSGFIVEQGNLVPLVRRPDITPRLDAENGWEGFDIWKYSSNPNKPYTSIDEALSTNIPGFNPSEFTAIAETDTVTDYINQRTKEKYRFLNNNGQIYYIAMATFGPMMQGWTK